MGRYLLDCGPQSDVIAILVIEISDVIAILVIEISDVKRQKTILHI